MKKDILRAFFSFGMWHIRSVYNPNQEPYYTSKNEEEMFNMLREKGFELLTATERFYLFKEI